MAEQKKTKAPTFERSLQRLEKLVAEMENGELDLEKMMAHFEEGTQLVKQCTTRLGEVEKKIEVLVKEGNELKTEPLDETDG